MIKKSVNINFISKLFKIADSLENQANERPTDRLDKLEEAANAVGKAWSGSWLGYHSRVYYKDLQPPPPGKHFSVQDGLRDIYSSDTIGDWEEYKFDELYYKIMETGGISDFSELQQNIKNTVSFFENSQAEVMSLLTIIEQENANDSFLANYIEKIKLLKIVSKRDYIDLRSPKGNIGTWDIAAINAGLLTPPHIEILAHIVSIRSPYQSCENLGKFTRRVASHLENLSTKDEHSKRTGTNVFIGHGNSLIWKDLKEFIQDRLKLPWDEFNRVPVAGITNISRLSQMLETAAIAFIIMTAEDEQIDAKIRARMNVIHEAGLFHGRLGFEKAIILLEEGCEEFSNIHGLGQIIFPKGKISAKFEEIRRVLEREGIIST